VARLRLGRGQPPDDLDQQAAGQFVVIEASRSDATADLTANSAGPANPSSPADPDSHRNLRDPGNPGGPGRPARSDGVCRPQVDPVRPLAPDFALDQPRTLHTGQQLRERHAGTRITDRGGQLRASHPIGVAQLVNLCQVRHDVLTRTHGPFSGRLSPDPHVSTLSHGNHACRRSHDSTDAL
jgi:hypothetical protein